MQSQYNEGVAWVELAALSNPAFVAQAITTTLGIKEIPGLDLVDSLTGFLENKEVLLVLDNCEHLLNECAEIIRKLLENCPNLQVLATSRERLYLDGEIVWHLSGLALPEGASLIQIEGNRSAAVNLFLERAVATGTIFKTSSAEEMWQVVEICRRLDGLPLALELVAAQTHWLSLTQIVSQLFKLPLTGGGNSNRAGVRAGKTMRSSFNWSYDLLSDPEKHLLQHLAIFRGSFALEAVEAICPDENLPTEQVKELLFSLINKSLVTVDNRPETLAGAALTRRYRLLEPVRQYGLEKHPPDHLYKCSYLHARYYLEFLEKRVPDLLGSEQNEKLLQVELELDNLQAALSWLTVQSNSTVTPVPPANPAAGTIPIPTSELALRMVSASWRIWYTRGKFTEGLTWLNSVLNTSFYEAADPEMRLVAKVLRDAGNMVLFQGDLTAAKTYLQKSRNLYEALADPAGIASVDSIMGQVLIVAGDYALAALYLEKSVYAFQKLKDARGAAITMGNYGWLASFSGEIEPALSYFLEAKKYFEFSRDEQGLTHCLSHLGRIRMLQGDFKVAGLITREGLSMARKLGLPLIIAKCLQDLADLEIVHIGNYQKAVSLALESFQLFYNMGVKIGLASCFERLVRAAYLAGEFELAVQMAGAASKIHDLTAIPIAKSEQAHYDTTLEKLYHGLNEDVFGDNWAEGRSTPPNKLLDLAARLQPLAVTAAKAEAVKKKLSANSNRPEKSVSFELSPRELAVLRLVSQGLSTTRVAAHLMISYHTVNSHLTAIYSKLNVNSRTEAIRYFLDYYPSASTSTSTGTGEILPANS